MKKSITLLTALLISVASFAQIGFNYKAVVRDANGNIVANQDIDVKFYILHQGPIIRSDKTLGPNSSSEVNVDGRCDIGGEGCQIKYSELHHTTTDANGIFIVNIGNGDTVLSGSFPQSNWSNGDSLKTEIDIEKDGSFVSFESTILRKVPMALKADIASVAGSVLNPQGLEEITEGDNTGWRLPRFSLNYGNIGDGAVDISYSDENSTTNGATGLGSVAMGLNTSASANYSAAIGNNTNAIGGNSIAMGIGTITVANASTALGKYNTADINGLFMVGNGTGVATGDRNNAFIIKEDGKTGINTSTPTSLFEVVHANTPPTPSNKTNALSIKNSSTDQSCQLYSQSNGSLTLYSNGSYRGFFHNTTGVYNSVSDRRLKKDITALNDGTLDKVMQLNPVSYLMKEQTDTKRNLGLISQEVQEIFPSVTHYVEESDLLTLSYTELIPILIKALQEQQDIIEAQDSKIELQNVKNIDQDTTITALLQRMDQLENTNNK